MESPLMAPCTHGAVPCAGGGQGRPRPCISGPGRCSWDPLIKLLVFTMQLPCAGGGKGRPRPLHPQRGARGAEPARIRGFKRQIRRARESAPLTTTGLSITETMPNRLALELESTDGYATIVAGASRRLLRNV